MRKAGTEEMALTRPEESERVALSGAQSSCRADRFFVAAGAYILSLNRVLCNRFFRSGFLVLPKYYTGISHSLHGVMVQGSSRDPSVPPPPGVYYHEFHEDNAGRVRAVVGNDVDGSRFVTDVLLYASTRKSFRNLVEA